MDEHFEENVDEISYRFEEGYVMKFIFMITLDLSTNYKRKQLKSTFIDPLEANECFK